MDVVRSVRGVFDVDFFPVAGGVPANRATCGNIRGARKIERERQSQKSKSELERSSARENARCNRKPKKASVKITNATTATTKPETKNERRINRESKNREMISNDAYQVVSPVSWCCQNRLPVCLSTKATEYP